MKILFLLCACAEKFRAAKIGAINVPLSPEASMAEFHAAKREDAMKILEFFCKRAERGLEILKFIGARRFGLQAASERESEILKFNAAEHLKSRFEPQKQAAEFLKFAPMPCNRFGILIKQASAARSYDVATRGGTRMGFLKFMRAITRPANAVQNFISQHRFGILKFTRTSARLADTAQNFISQRGFKILKLICEPPRTPSRVLPSADKAEVGRAENFSKFDLTGALLNFKSCFVMQLCSAVTRRNYEAWRSEIYAVCLHKYPALIRAASGKISRCEVERATNALLSQGVKKMKFCAPKRHTMKFLKFLGARRLGLQAAVGRGFKILKFSAAERLKRRFEPQKQAAKPLNSSSLSPCRFKLALLKFTPEVPRNRSEILKFTLARRKFKLVPCKSKSEPRKFKPMPAIRLNFTLNSAPQARAAKFENGVKFKDAAKFKRGVR